LRNAAGSNRNVVKKRLRSVVSFWCNGAFFKDLFKDQGSRGKQRGIVRVATAGFWLSVPKHPPRPREVALGFF
jgi:hypothetical protein